MAFIGMVFVGIFLLILFVIFILMLVSIITAIILKKKAKNNKSKKMKIVGNVFLVLGILFALPLIGIAGFFILNFVFEPVTLPDNTTKFVLASDISKMKELALSGDSNSIKKLDKLLDHNTNLVFYHDVNQESVLDYGLETGNLDVVKIAIKYGATFDNPIRYDRMAYVGTSMHYYLRSIGHRSITKDDIEILKLMFENDAQPDIKGESTLYSNVFGMAIWTILYNDETVTDIELEFIQVFIDNEISCDNAIVLYEDLSSNWHFSEDFHADVKKDDNYIKIMDIIGR